MSNELTSQDRAVASAQLIPETAKAKLKAFWSANKNHIMSVVSGKDTKAHEMALYSCLYRTPALINCTPFSLLNSLVLANQLGLRVGTQECAIVPFKNEAQLLIQYQGKVKLALASKLIKSVEADVVYDFETFHWKRTAAGLDFLHEPDFRKRALQENIATDRNIIGAYCQMGTDGGMQTRFVDLGEILDARAKSRSYSKDPKGSFWTTDFAAACLKTAVHRASKLAPQDARMATATQVDDEDTGGPAVIADGLDPSQFAIADTQAPLAELSKGEQADVATQKIETLTRSAKPSTAKTITQEQQDALQSAWVRDQAALPNFLRDNGVPSGKLADVKAADYGVLMGAVRNAQ